MRYSVPVYFVKETEPVYDYETGDYVDGEPIKEEVWANVSDKIGRASCRERV